jgi:hypothetical protein
VGSTAWHLKGKVLVACNCDYGCPCNFNARPSTGKCEGGWTWHVEDGEFDGTNLDGLTFGVYVNWPGAIHEGNGEAVIYIDEQADEAQQTAINALVGGDHGGPWGVLAWTWPTIHGPKLVPYEVDFDGIHSRVKIGSALELTSTAIKNPVTGNEVHPGAVLPEGIIVKAADFGASEVFRLDDDVSYDHTGRYTAVGAFDYASA